MSEFKYACPYCGQHIKCDLAQGGTTMECPTCFQKIIAPQSPASADPKFILTGAKATRRSLPFVTTKPAEARAGAPERKIPVAAIVIAAAILAVGAGVYFLGGKVFHFWPATTWQTGDVGNVGAGGSFSRAKAVFTISGNGADIWGQSDAFRYVYRPLNGDVTLTVRVVDIQNTDPWAKAGLMIRKSLNPDSSYALVFVSPLSGISFQQRNRTADWASAVGAEPPLHAPCWIRLTRQKNNFTAYSSADGKSWKPVGSTTVSMEGPVFAGLAVCSHKTGTLCRATFDHFSLKTKPAD